MQTNPSQTSPEKVHRYPCQSCGANLIFEPKDGVLTCPYCGHKERIPKSADQVEERSYEQYLQLRPEQLERMAANALEVQCETCGATVTFTPPDVARQCDFCGAQIVAQPKSADPMLAPEGVLPFLLTQPEASTALREWLASRWFAPNALKHFAQPDAIDGVYLPFWTYDAYTTSYYTGQRGEHYYESQTYYESDGKGGSVQRTRQVQRTRWYPASGTVERWFDDILVPATVSLSQAHLEALEPWDIGGLKPYDPAFLSGFKAQRYQVGLAEGFDRARQIAAPAIENDVRNDIGGDAQQIEEIQTHYSGITFKHLLLPVYAGAYRFNQKVYQIVVNGRTGEIQGDRPYSAWKIAALATAVLIAVLIIIFIVSESS